MQVAAGVDAVQIFDSWANVLTCEEHAAFCLAPLQELTAAAKVPAIFFMRGSGPYLETIPCAISLDWTICPRGARERTLQPLQGNLNPDVLYEPLDAIRNKTRQLLELMHGDPAFIVNLGHGVKPNTPIEAVRCFVESVRAWP